MTRKCKHFQQQLTQQNALQSTSNPFTNVLQARYTTLRATKKGRCWTAYQPKDVTQQDIGSLARDGPTSSSKPSIATPVW